MEEHLAQTVTIFNWGICGDYKRGVMASPFPISSKGSHSSFGVFLHPIGLVNIPLLASSFKNQLLGSTFSSAQSLSSWCHQCKISQPLPLLSGLKKCFREWHFPQFKNQTDLGYSTAIFPKCLFPWSDP